MPVCPAGGGIACSQPTYEGLKLDLTIENTGTESVRSQPTYEGLNPPSGALPTTVWASSQPTYEGLKLALREAGLFYQPSSQPTYEGLKLSSFTK